MDWILFCSMAKEESINQQLIQIGARLKALRKAKGYSNYEQFAFQHGIGRAQYGRYEKGDNLQVDTLLRLLAALEVTPAEFFSEGFGEE